MVSLTSLAGKRSEQRPESAGQRLHVVYISCSSYADDGYPRRFRRGILPSNTLGCLKALTDAIAASGRLGDGTVLTASIYDDTVQTIPVERIARLRRHGKVLVGLAGVQSGQFARAMDLAMRFREAGLPVMIGGFHVSGSLALHDEPTRELRQLMDAGVSLIKGEAESEDALIGILRDALRGEMKRIYEMPARPELSDAAIPVLDEAYRRRFFSRRMMAIDTSRGCPFNCSFCTVINVLGRQMRARCAQRILRDIEANHARGIRSYFFVDDNLARSPVWEELFDGLIAMRERGVAVDFMMQVDTLAHRIPRFVEKAKQAGCYSAFIGMESLDEANLKAIGKRQNHVEDYAAMVEAWHEADVIVHVGYIIGLPHDTPESVDEALLRMTEEVKVDQASFFMLTPLPGSRDHAAMVEAGTVMDADLNNFDSLHPTFQHPQMSGADWLAAYDRAWERFYSVENITRILLRTPRKRYWELFWLLVWHRYSMLAGEHPMFSGFGRVKRRKERRRGYALEGRVRFAWSRLREVAWTSRTYARLFFEFQGVWLMTRQGSEPRRQAVAELRWRCRETRQHIERGFAAGRDSAVTATAHLVDHASQCLRELARSGHWLKRRSRRELLRLARQLQTWRASLGGEQSEATDIEQLHRVVTEEALPACEGAISRDLRIRHRLNRHWQRWRRGFTDRAWFPRLVVTPAAVVLEVIASLRFALAFHRKA